MIDCGTNLACVLGRCVYALRSAHLPNRSADDSAYRLRHDVCMDTIRQVTAGVPFLPRCRSLQDDWTDRTWTPAFCHHADVCLYRLCYHDFTGFIRHLDDVLPTFSPYISRAAIFTTAPALLLLPAPFRAPRAHLTYYLPPPACPHHADYAYHPTPRRPLTRRIHHLPLRAPTAATSCGNAWMVGGLDRSCWRDGL